MPAIGYQYNFLRGLSDFWQRFFADADQLEALYDGTAILIGQAYLDYMSTVLGVALKDAVVFDREYYHLLAMREDEVRYVEGDVPADSRWAFSLPDSIVSFASVDNKVFEPTASLEEQRDFDIVDRVAYFKVDPTNPTGNGLPLPGYARRSVDVSVGGSFTDTAVAAWTTATAVAKGDTLRLLDVGPGPGFIQRKREDHTILVVRDSALFVSPDSALAAPASGINFVVLRVPFNASVLAESFVIAGSQATLAHTRIDIGSVRVYAKGPTGADVVEGVDYTFNYESGIIYQVTVWQGLPGPYGIDYTWKKEVYPAVGTSPRKSSTGKIVSSTTTTRVLQLAAWTPDTFVDRRTLANNFGSFVGRENNSSEAYRAFLEGIFQLYILGPVLQRIESALNVVLNFPVVRDDGETYQSTDFSDPGMIRLYTMRPPSGQIVTYEFPIGTPMRTDLVVGQELLSFEPLTTAVTVTDYVQTPQWWYGQTIPPQLFTPMNGDVPEVFRRIASPFYIQNVVDPVDGAQIGDPGLVVGADEDGFIATPRGSDPPLRHRMAFVLMDRYLKYHTFSVSFNATALSATVGSGFAQSLKDLNELVLSAKPSHTFAFTTPTTAFRDEIIVEEDAISFDRLVGSRIYGPDKVIFTDTPPLVGGGVWLVGDYFKYELFTALTAFPVVAVPVTLANTPILPRRGYVVRAFVNGNVGGVALVENVDYTVNYFNRTITRLTAWAVTTVNVTFRQLNIGNLVDAPIGAGDMPLLVNGVDPAAITAAFNPSAAGWDGINTPTTAPRDIGLVERALIVYAHA
jgi:hypothetical protein